MMPFDIMSRNQWRECLHTCQNVSNQMLSSSKSIQVVPLLAGGAYSGGPSYHSGKKLPCSDKILLSNVGVCGAKSDILMRLHGLFMVVAWLGFAGTGMLFARYFRQTWVGKPVGGKDLWFQAHR